MDFSDPEGFTEDLIRNLNCLTLTEGEESSGTDEVEIATDTHSSDEIGIKASGNGERCDSGSTEEIGCESSSSTAHR